MAQTLNNETAAAAAVGTVLLWFCYKGFKAAGAGPLVVQMLGWVTLFAVIVTVFRLIRDFRLWLLLQRLMTPRGIYGRIGGTGTINGAEIGLKLSNPNGDGIPVGTDDGKNIAYWDGAGHGNVRAPTEQGKTASFFLPATVSLGAHRNIITTGKGAEVAYKSYKYRSEVLGQKVFNIDPWGEAARLGLPTHKFNPIGHLVTLAKFRSPELGEKTRQFAYTLKPEDAKASGENKVFRSVARDMVSEVSRYRAICEAEHGELICNPVGLYRDFCGSTENLLQVFREMQSCPDYDGAISAAGFRFEGVFRDTPKSAQSFLSEVTEALAIYEPSGVLAKNVEYSDFDPHILKTPDGPGVTINLIIPPGKSDIYGRHIGLVLDALATTALEASRFAPRVTLLLDEFEMLFDGVWPTAERILKTGRSAGVNMITAVQETAGFSAYGDKASMWTTQPELVMAWGIRSTSDAEDYAKRAGKRSIVPISGGAKTDEHSLSYSMKEEGIDLMRIDEFMQMGPYRAAVFYKQNPLLLVDLVHVKSVDGWAQHIPEMPDAQPEPAMPLRFKA